MKKKIWYLFFQFFVNNIVHASAAHPRYTAEDSPNFPPFFHLNPVLFIPPPSLPSIISDPRPRDMQDILQLIPRENPHFAKWSPIDSINISSKTKVRLLKYRRGQYLLGRFYAQEYLDILPSNIFERAIPKTLNKAQECYYIAAVLGGIESQYFLGLSYLLNHSTLALEVLECLASKKYAPAQFSLGQLYYYGSSVPQDYAKAYRFLDLVSHSDPRERHLDKKAKTLSIYYKGICFHKGRGVTENNVRAYECFQYAGLEGCREAQYQLGRFYSNGIYVSRDLMKSFLWFERASKQNYIPATYEVAKCYYYGEGIPQNIPKAIELYKSLSLKNYLPALHHLGIIYFKGEKVIGNFAEGLNLLEKAASRKYARSEFELYKIYTTHPYYSSNRDWRTRGLFFLRQAAAQHYEPALTIFRRMQ